MQFRMHENKQKCIELKEAFCKYLILIPARTTLWQWLRHTGSTGQCLWCIHFIRFEQTEHGPITNFPKMWSIENDSNSQRKRNTDSGTPKTPSEWSEYIVYVYVNVNVCVQVKCDNGNIEAISVRKKMNLLVMMLNFAMCRPTCLCFALKSKFAACAHL